MVEPDESRRSERARGAILAATRDLVAEVGYARVGIEGIARVAGVGKQTIYRWWPSKAAVVFDALLEVSAPHGSVDVPDSGDIDSDLRELARGMVAALADPVADRLHRAVAAEIQVDQRVAEDLVTRLLQPQLDAVADRLRVAATAGQVDPSVDPTIGVELLVGPLFHRWLLRTGPLDAGLADAVADLVARALRPGASA